MKKIFPVLALTALLAACEAENKGAEPVTTASVAPATASIGQPAPDFDLTFLNHEGGDSLADLRGRVVLIEFWRTW
jgi:nitrous oxide reductase accessory protein NosL